MDKEITLYGHDGCSHCVRAKAWFEGKGIVYTTKNILDEEVVAEFAEYNSPGIPLIIIRNVEAKTEQKIIGFNIEKLEHALN
ncbi:glutaredoxin family protein (plasmid) [Bacillus thuringiensis]|uniref:glutaredoxin family protein n=1 Tax=Bacillus wiedmannii TaxID=1890302 RepID=UPI000D08FD7E|nr:glutaredoxin family protein [Bacillus wiedmannii]PRT15845.1 glutaredoxin family protein [Bacillus wiedmannii]QPW51619.1 glutaredoxin family protein [Bacillus thuringiensis]